MSRTARYSFMGTRGGSGHAALPCISARIVSVPSRRSHRPPDSSCCDARWTSIPSPSVESATSAQRSALTALRRIPAMKSSPVITASRRPRSRATSSDSTPRPRRRGRQQVASTAVKSESPNGRACPRPRSEAVRRYPASYPGRALAGGSGLPGELRAEARRGDRHRGARRGRARRRAVRRGRRPGSHRGVRARRARRRATGAHRRRPGGCSG